MKFPYEVPFLGRFRFHHMVTIAMHGVTRLEPHGNESETQVLGGDASQGRGIALVHQSENFGSRHPITILFGFRTTETGMKHIFQRRVAIVCLVASLHFLFFLLIQVITLTIQHLLLQLGIELLVFNRFVRNHIGHFHTKEASASRRVTQDLVVAMNEAKRGSVTYPKRLPRYTGTDII